MGKLIFFLQFTSARKVNFGNDSMTFHYTLFIIYIFFKSSFLNILKLFQLSIVYNLNNNIAERIGITSVRMNRIVNLNKKFYYKLKLLRQCLAVYIFK